MSQKEEAFLRNRVNELISHSPQSFFALGATEEVLWYYRANLIDKNIRNDLIKDIYEKFLEYTDSTNSINEFIKRIRGVKSLVPHNGRILFNIEKKGSSIHKALAVNYRNISSSIKNMVWFKSIADAEKYLDNYLNANPRRNKNDYIIDHYLTRINQALEPYSDDYGQGYQIK